MLDNHWNFHRTEYLRKVRVMAKEDCGSSSSKNTHPQEKRKPNSLRVAIASDMAAQILRLEQIVQDRDAEIERLCKLLDAKMMI